MATVDKPMVSNEATKVFLRPILSPKWPNSAEPMGRAKNASASVDSDRMIPAVSSVFGKNWVLKTSTAAAA